jgi:hypothetical protein
MTAILKPPFADNSTLAAYDVCPFQGYAIEQALVPNESPEMAAGTAGHAVLAELIDEFREIGRLQPMQRDLGDKAEHHPLYRWDSAVSGLIRTRPDVMPETIRGLARGVWGLANLLNDHHRVDVLRYQGGQGDASGQVTRKLGDSLITSELDLLLRTRAANVLHEVDFKTGQTHWMVTDVDCFQFQCHNWLLRETYPQLDKLLVQVYPTRYTLLDPVLFTNEDADAFEWRLLAILRERDETYVAAEVGKPIATRPGECCLRCPAVTLCACALDSAKELADDPAIYALRTMVWQEAIEKRVDAQIEHVRAHGPIALPDGRTFGVAPSREAKPRRDQYKIFGGRE